VTSEENKRVYTRYIELLNAQHFAALPEVVDPERYREICVGFTPGWVDPPRRWPRCTRWLAASPI
jgi:hypothetical protein